MTKIQQQELIASYNYVTIHLYLHENITRTNFHGLPLIFFYNFVHGNVFKWIHFHKKIDNDQMIHHRCLLMDEWYPQKLNVSKV